MIWGVVACLGGEAGALALYLGFRHAAFSVAGPLSAVASAAFSVLAGLLLGERPSALDLTGIALALPAIVGVSMSVPGPAALEPGAAVAPGAAGPPGRARAPAGVVYGLAAGAGFGMLFIGLNQAGLGERAVAGVRRPGRGPSGHGGAGRLHRGPAPARNAGRRAGRALRRRRGARDDRCTSWPRTAGCSP